MCATSASTAKMSDRLRKTLAFTWAAYKIVATVSGTLLLGLMLLGLLRAGPAQKIDRMPLHSGFVFSKVIGQGQPDRYQLTDARGAVAVAADVVDFRECGPIVYGYRRDERGHPYYFFCAYGTDCHGSQYLNDVELRKLVSAGSLPPYRWSLVDETGGRFDFLSGIESAGEAPTCSSLGASG